jgi:hypothetical protein
MVRFSWKKDPRENILFKYCYKLVNETSGKLNATDYEIYLRAQIAVIKNVHDVLAKDIMISERCLVGEKAWKRYVFYKHQYDLKLQLKSAKEVGVSLHDYSFVINELKRSKKVLTAKLGDLNKESIEKAVNGRAIFRWHAVGLISGYYLALSEIAKKSQFYPDLSLYRDGLTPEVKEFFKQEFGYEIIN